MIAAQLAVGQSAVCTSCRARSGSVSMLAMRRAVAPLVARGLSTRVCAAATPEQAQDSEGVKSKLYEILTDSKPLSAAELWEEAQKRGVRSKRHMKLVLQDLRLRGWVITKPGAIATAKKDKAFRYQLSQKTLNSVRFKGAAPESASS